MTKKGVWDLQDVRDKQLINEWTYINDEAPYTLWMWGNNQEGLTGQNTSAPGPNAYSSPVQIPGDWRGVQGSKGTWSEPVLAVKNNGTLWTWGKGGETGWGNNKVPTPGLRSYSSPTQIPGTTWPNNIDAMGVGGYVLQGMVKTNGQLWVWGTNYFGGLGQNQPSASGSSADRSSPVQIPGTTWKYIASSKGHFMTATKTNGTLWTWGNGGRGSLGMNTSHDGGTIWYSSPVQVGTDTTWDKPFNDGDGWGVGCIKTDGTLWIWGQNETWGWGTNEGGPSDEYRSSPCQVAGTTWERARVYAKAIGAIKTDGTLWMWGDNGSGRLGHSDQVSRSSPTQLPGTNWAAVGVGNGWSMAIKTDGSLWTWGSNTNGILGLGLQPSDAPGYSSPMQVPGVWMPRLGTQNGTVAMACKLPS